VEAALSGLGALTLLVEDLNSSASFYGEVLGLEAVHRDENSTVFDLGKTLIDLLRADPSGTVWEIAQDIPVDAAG
jgi:catechol-2,3-dioxygenase